MADIINSNLNAMLDKAEDPQKMIRLIIQEMEETLVEVRSSSARIIADKKTAERKLERVQAEINDWESKARLAISKVCTSNVTRPTVNGPRSSRPPKPVPTIIRHRPG